MGARNLYLTPDERIDLRVGINLGDIIVDGEDIAGDGVNVAARLETLAEPGGICVASAVWEQVHEDLGVEFVDAGEQHVKNISKPIRVYRVALGKGVAEKSHAAMRVTEGLPARLLAGHRVAIFAVIGAVVVSLGLGIWQWTQHQAQQTRTIDEARAPPLMSVAVMPFVSASAGADGDRLAERITADVTSAIEHSMRSARVVSHGLVAKYKDKSIDPRVAGRELNVRYLVEGDMRDENGAVVIVSQLVETANATQVWSVRLTAPAAAASDRNSELVAQLASRLRHALYDAEQKRVSRLPATDADALGLVLHAGAVWDQDPSPNAYLAARKLYEEALRHDSTSVPALLGISSTIWTELWDNPRADRERLVKELDDATSRAISLDRDDPSAWIYRAFALSWQGQWERALETNAEAMRIDPYRDSTLGSQGFLLIVAGRPEEALPFLDRAIALDPRGPSVSVYLQWQCSADVNLGRYDDAIAACEKALALDDYWFRHLLLVAAYAQRGDMAKAAAAKAELLKRQPGVSIAGLRELQVYSPSYLQQVEATRFAGLRKAGIPER
jgi:TolB-like protein